MASAFKRSLSRRFSSRSSHQSDQSPVAAPKNDDSLVLWTSGSVLQTQTTASTPANDHRAPMKARLLTDDEIPKLRSISKATISAPVMLDSPLYPPSNPSQATPKESELRHHQGSVASQQNQPDRRSAVVTCTARNTTALRGSVNLVDCNGPAKPLPSPSTTITTGSSSSDARPATATPGMLKDTIPIPFNPSLPAYVLDRIHPCIPLPAPWSREHDQYIVSLDVQDYHLPAIVRRLKQRFPELKAECITPGMVDKRLRILDLRVYWQGWKRAISSMPPTGHVDDFDSGFDDGPSMTASGPSTPQPDNTRKKVLANVANIAKPHRRRISTGGMSGKITIDKRGTSVTNLSVGGPSTPPASAPHTPVLSRYHFRHVPSSVGHGNGFTNGMLNESDSSPLSPATAWATGAAPSSPAAPPSTPLTIPEKAAAQLAARQHRGSATLNSPLKGSTSSRRFSASNTTTATVTTSAMVLGQRQPWDGSTISYRGGSGGMVHNTGSGKGKGVVRVGFGRVEDERESLAMGVPSVMRTSSGRPVLR